MASWPNDLLTKTSQTSNHDAVMCIPLSSPAFFTVTGPDASGFLQGQLTCDVEKLEYNKASFGAHCNAKGRVISLFTLSKISDDQYGFHVDQSMRAIAFAALQKYSVFSKVSLSHCDDWLSFALVSTDETGKEIDQALHSLAAKTPFLTVHRPHATLAECWLHSDAISAIKHDLNACQLMPESVWLSARIRHGITTMYDVMSENYLPQELRLQALGGLSFKKGCYTGQEVIARLHYKGKLKKRIVHLVIEYNGEHAIDTRTGLMHTDTQKHCGDILAIAQNTKKNHYELLTLLDTTAAMETIALANMPIHILQWNEMDSTAIP